MSILLKSTTDKKDYNINVYKKEPKEAEHSLSRTCKIQRSKKKTKKKTMNNSLKRKL